METSSYSSQEKWDSLSDKSELFKHLCTRVLPQYLYKCRWFGGKGNKLVSCTVDDVFHLQDGFRHYYFLALEVFFKESFAHHYFLPLALSNNAKDLPEAARISQVNLEGKSHTLIDAVFDPGFHLCLYRRLIENATLSSVRQYSRVSELESSRTRLSSRLSREQKAEYRLSPDEHFGRKSKEVGGLYRQPLSEGSQATFRKTMELESDEKFTSHLLSAEQSNSTIVVQDKYFLKIFRRLFRDKNPDFEINEFLAGQSLFKNVPRLAGLISWKLHAGFEISLGLMQEKVENDGDAWNWMLKELEAYFKLVPAESNQKEVSALLKTTPIKKLPENLLQKPGVHFFELIQTLAQRTAQMHLALSSERRDRAFVPVHYNADFTVWLKNRLIFQFEARYNLLQKKLNLLPPEAQIMARQVMEAKDLIINFILDFNEENLRSARIRIHGDYHLGQILIQDNDFFILDFEGEPESTIRDRKVKQSPLKDVAGLFRSFHYAIFATLFKEKAVLPPSDRLHQSKALYKAMVGVFLDTYYKIAFEHNLDIGYQKEIRYLLHYFILEKAIYELGYELNGRPEWAIIPLRGITEIIKEIEDYAQ